MDDGFLELAIEQARIGRSEGSQECVDLMTEFIAAEPSLWNEDIGEPDGSTADEAQG